MSQVIRHVLLVAVVAAVASSIALLLFWSTGSRRIAAVTAAIASSLAVTLGSRRLRSAPTATAIPTTQTSTEA
ncbi:MAG: hypothetical protein U1E73_12260 [Planctomycetota bacterium]